MLVLLFLLPLAVSETPPDVGVVDCSHNLASDVLDGVTSGKSSELPHDLLDDVETTLREYGESHTWDRSKIDAIFARPLSDEQKELVKKMLYVAQYLSECLQSPEDRAVIGAPRNARDAISDSPDADRIIAAAEDLLSSLAGEDRQKSIESAIDRANGHEKTSDAGDGGLVESVAKLIGTAREGDRQTVIDTLKEGSRHKRWADVDVQIRPGKVLDILKDAFRRLTGRGEGKEEQKEAQPAEARSPMMHRHRHKGDKGPRGHTNPPDNNLAGNEANETAVDESPDAISPLSGELEVPDYIHSPSNNVVRRRRFSLPSFSVCGVLPFLCRQNTVQTKGAPDTTVIPVLASTPPLPPQPSQPPQPPQPSQDAVVPARPRLPPTQVRPRRPNGASGQQGVRPGGQARGRQAAPH